MTYKNITIGDSVKATDVYGRTAFGTVSWISYDHKGVYYGLKERKGLFYDGNHVRKMG